MPSKTLPDPSLHFFLSETVSLWPSEIGFRLMSPMWIAPLTRPCDIFCGLELSAVITHHPLALNPADETFT